MQEGIDYTTLAYQIASDSTSSLQASSGPSATPSPSPAKVITINETELGYLRIRDGPATSYNEIGQVDIGQTFEVFEESSGWYQIEYEDGKYGWVSGNYLTVNWASP